MNRFSSKVVYTAVFGNYDKVQPVNSEWDCDFICFTDNPTNISKGWEIRIVRLEGELPNVANRRYKMLPHKYLENYDYSLYVDGNIKIESDPSPLFEKYLSDSALAAPKHPFRTCAYLEAEACVSRELVSGEIVKLQMARYRAHGFPMNYGLTANGILLRKHHDENLIDMMNDWWGEYSSGGRRDQLSLAYLSWKREFLIEIMSESVWSKNKYFRINLHESQKHITLLGRLVDYIICNRYRSYMHESAYQLFKLIESIFSFRSRLR